MEEYDIHFGARSLQHAVDKLIINPIAAAHEKVRLICLLNENPSALMATINSPSPFPNPSNAIRDPLQEELQPGDSVHVTAEGQEITLQITHGRNATKGKPDAGGLTGWLFGGGKAKNGDGNGGDSDVGPSDEGHPTATRA